MADDESESGMESGWESDGGNELRMAARLGQQLLRQKQELAARLEVVEKENDRLRDRYGRVEPNITGTSPRHDLWGRTSCVFVPHHTCLGHPQLRLDDAMPATMH